MKRFKAYFFPLLVAALCWLCSLGANAQVDPLARMDSIEIGLLTCSPHNEVYSLYGHSALHYYNKRTRKHWVFNYGVFDQRAKLFVWHFMMGQTDYTLECTSSYLGFLGYYHHWGSSVEEQVLDLTRHEKLRLQQALEANLRQPDYRYNIFYDNCSTRPRDIIERCLDGTITYGQRPDYEPTLRQIVHQQTEGHPWARFGNDLLLGLRADLATTQRDRQFLPQNLSWDFAHATVNRNGTERPLVLKTVTLVPQGSQVLKKEFPLSPLACTLLLLCVSLLLFVYEQRSKKILWWWDVLLMLASGLTGCILLLMFFSAHPTTSTNLQVLLLCPLSLVFLPQVVKRRKTIWFRISAVLTILFLIGSFWQDYAEGMEIVALCLLLRCWTHRNDK